ncbi:unnamed protein product [Ilex paraguariensis]|uniref:RING-type E3 ubiquitin transferase n=1 Tax=Ilex paraguariensis TaxID=185542 RepID=A0ABC8TFK6_9AQUA
MLCALKCSGLISGQTSDRPTGRLANTGIKKKVLNTFPVVSYSAYQVKQPGFDTVCVICLSEFSSGELVRVLPKCNHGFHVLCIDRWLNIHSSCPTCRHCLVETCQKIVGSSQASTSEPQSPPPTPPQSPSPSSPESVMRIGPLEPEGLLRKCQT